MDDVAPTATARDGWTSEVSSGLALAGFLFLVFIGFTLLAMGPLISLDAYFNLAPPPPTAGCPSCTSWTGSGSARCACRSWPSRRSWAAATASPGGRRGWWPRRCSR